MDVDKEQELTVQGASEVLSKSVEELRIEMGISKEKWNHFIDEWNSIPCTSFTFTKEQLQTLSKSVGSVSISNSDTICREVRDEK